MGEATTGPSAEPAMPDRPEMTVSTRDAEDLRGVMARWLGARLGSEGLPAVSPLSSNDTNGMSSETLLFDARWVDADGREHTEDLVARIAPDAANEPVFATYEVGNQFELMRLVDELTDVPVPTVRWLETDPSVIGSPFFLMDRVDGIVPPDVMPYNFGDSWLYDASPEQQRHLQDATVAVLAGLHAIPDAEARFSFLATGAAGDTPLRRHVAHTRDWYAFAAERARPSSLIEDGFAWLEAHWPDESAPVLSWGDSRIGNVMYRDFEPVAVLDWEMAGIGPRELDIGWLVFAHMVFETIAGAMGLGGMPDFLRADDVAAAYEQRTGYAPRDLDFYLVYAAIQWGVVFMRTGTRQVHFGEIPMPDDIHDLMHHRDLFRRLLDS